MTTFNFDPLFGSVLLLFGIIIILVVYIFNKLQLIVSLKRNIQLLNQNIQELDHQAKLIIKSDMELKLYQEEVEDKLNKLTLLKNLILSSIHILDREDLFAQISEKIINDLGFKNGLILTFDDLQDKVNIGFTVEELEKIRNFLTGKKKILLTQTTLGGESEPCKPLASSLGTKNILIGPLRAREKNHGIFIVGTPLLPKDIQNADRAIFSIICMYLGQCLDNISLFEEMYLNKDDLERKIKERTNELVKSLRDIETMSQTKSDFISSVSHELRTPLTSVKGFSSLLVAGKFGELPPEAKKRLEKIDENVNKLVEMVNVLLDIARIESGKTEVKIAPYDIVKLLHDVGDFLSPQIQAKKITLTFDAPKLLGVCMDKSLIEQVLVNLVNNSIKFTPQGGKIVLGCKAENNLALVSVADSGCGIPKEDRGRVFQEFYRSSETKKLPGTGLGLSLVKRIIDTHKEKIWVESELNKGTTLYFTLKLEENV